MENYKNKNFNFNKRIILQKEVQNKDNFGGINYTFDNIAEVWGCITPINLNQNFAKMKQECEITHNIEIRYMQNAKECKKILFGKRVFLVLGVFCQDEQNEFLTFRVKEVL